LTSAVLTPLSLHLPRPQARGAAGSGSITDLSAAAFPCFAAGAADWDEAARRLARLGLGLVEGGSLDYVRSAPSGRLPVGPDDRAF
jgi:hypothetical protein